MDNIVSIVNSFKINDNEDFNLTNSAFALVEDIITYSFYFTKSPIY